MRTLALVLALALAGTSIVLAEAPSADARPACLGTFDADCGGVVCIEETQYTQRSCFEGGPEP